VVEVLSTGEVRVQWLGKKPSHHLCDFLDTGAPVKLRPGDQVLVVPGSSPEEKGCVLGRVGPYREPPTKHVVLSAEEELTIRCGDGAIILRRNGQILLRGLDIVSHARRSNRVRGGSIELN
jgi:hypothetical protein